MPVANSTPAAAAVAPCGPECRYASPMPNLPGDWLWCARRGEPRASGGSECRYFAPGPAPVEERPGSRDA